MTEASTEQLHARRHEQNDRPNSMLQVLPQNMSGTGAPPVKALSNANSPEFSACSKDASCNPACIHAAVAPWIVPTSAKVDPNSGSLKPVWPVFRFTCCQSYTATRLRPSPLDFF